MKIRIVLIISDLSLIILVMFIGNSNKVQRVSQWFDTQIIIIGTPSALTAPQRQQSSTLRVSFIPQFPFLLSYVRMRCLQSRPKERESFLFKGSICFLISPPPLDFPPLEWTSENTVNSSSLDDIPRTFFGASNRASSIYRK